MPKTSLRSFGSTGTRPPQVGTRILLVGFFGVVFGGFAGWLIAGPPEAPPVSNFASVKALMGGVDYYMDSIESKSLAKPDRYTDASKTRVAKDGATLMLLFQSLGLHDEDSAVKASAPRLIELAAEVVASADDFEKTRAAFDALKKGIVDGAEGGQPLKWEKRCDLELLMKQVTTVNNRLKRNTKKETSLAKRKDDAIGQSALLAVIGQATLLDPEVVEDESQLGEWYRLCEAMRDSAGDVEKAIAAGDFASVTKNMKILQKSCDDCHEVFRIETD
jgi:hypothetical protein